MKKVIVIAIALFVAVNLNAQIGAKVGLNFSGMNSTTSIDGSKMRTGMHLGVVYEKDLIAILNLRIEGVYSQQGFAIYNEYQDYMATGQPAVMDQVVKIDYLQIPVLLKAKLGPVYAVAGPYFGIALSGKTVSELTLDGAVQDLGDNASVDIFGDNSYYKRTDYGFGVGVGSQFGLGPIQAFAEARGTFGLASMYDTNSDSYKALVTLGALKDTDYTKNLTIGLSVGVILGGD